MSLHHSPLAYSAHLGFHFSVLRSPLPNHEESPPMPFTAFAVRMAGANLAERPLAERVGVCVHSVAMAACPLRVDRPQNLRHVVVGLEGMAESDRK